MQGSSSSCAVVLCLRCAGSPVARRRLLYVRVAQLPTAGEQIGKLLVQVASVAGLGRLAGVVLHRCCVLAGMIGGHYSQPFRDYCVWMACVVSVWRFAVSWWWT